MARRSLTKTPTKAGKSKSLVSAAVGAGKSLLGLKGKGAGKKRRKKSTSWFVRETARLKAKKKYDKLKLGM
jgi:hypothetical protein